MINKLGKGKVNFEHAHPNDFINASFSNEKSYINMPIIILTLFQILLLKDTIYVLD